MDIRENYSRNKGLDILKFAAAIFIVLGHCHNRLNVESFQWGLFDFTDVVELFFIISGFLSRDLSRFKTADGLVKRVVRLYPMIFITTTVMIMIEEYKHLVYGIEGNGVLRTFTSYLLLFKYSVFPGQVGIDPYLWYVNILIFCYCIAYVIKKLEEKLDISYLLMCAAIVLLGASCVMYGGNLPFWNYYTGRGMAAFFLGVILHEAIERFRPKRWWFITIVECFIVALTFKWMLEENMDRIENIWAVECFVLFPCIFHIAYELGRFIKLNVLSILGDISFEIYIWQYIGFMIIENIMRSNNIDTVNTTVIIVFIVALIVWGFLMNRYVEKPMNSYVSSKFINKSFN